VIVGANAAGASCEAERTAEACLSFLVIQPEFVTLPACARPSPRLREYRKFLRTIKSLSSSRITAQVRETIAAAFPLISVVFNAETKDRDAQVALFQASEKHRLFVTSPRIGGLGITLTAASAVLIIEFDFTSAVMLQGEDRVHRLGQSRNVTGEYLYADKTVDGFMLSLINRKQRIFDQACDGLADPDYLLRLSKKARKASGSSLSRQPTARKSGRTRQVQSDPRSGLAGNPDNEVGETRPRDNEVRLP
jgi:hypothetical protein